MSGCFVCVLRAVCGGKGVSLCSSAAVRVCASMLVCAPLSSNCALQCRALQLLCVLAVSAGCCTRGRRAVRSCLVLCREVSGFSVAARQWRCDR